MDTFFTVIFFVFFHYAPYFLGAFVVLALAFRQIPALPTPFGFDFISNLIINFGWWFFFASLIAYGMAVGFKRFSLPIADGDPNLRGWVGNASLKAFFLQKALFVPSFPASFSLAGFLTIVLAYLAKPAFDFIEGLVYMIRSVSGLQAIRVASQTFQINPVLDSPALTYLLAGVLPIVMIIIGIGRQVNGTVLNVTGARVPEHSIWMGYIIPATSIMILVFMWRSGAFSASPQQIFSFLAVLLSPGIIAIAAMIFFIRRDFILSKKSFRGYFPAFQKVGIVLLKTVGVLAAVWLITFLGSVVGLSAALQQLLSPVMIGVCYLLAGGLIITSISFPFVTFEGAEGKKFLSTLFIIIFTTIAIVNLELPSADTSAKAMLWPWKVSSAEEVAATRQDAKDAGAVFKVVTDPSTIVKQDFTISGLLGGQAASESLLSGNKKGKIYCVITDASQKTGKPNPNSKRCVRNAEEFQKSVGFPPPKTQMAPKLGYIVMLNLCVLFDILLQGDVLYNFLPKWAATTLDESLEENSAKAAFLNNDIIGQLGAASRFVAYRTVLYTALWFNLLTSALFEDGRVQNLTPNAIIDSFKDQDFCLIFLKWVIFVVAQYILQLWLSVTIAEIAAPTSPGIGASSGGSRRTQ